MTTPSDDFDVLVIEDDEPAVVIVDEQPEPVVVVATMGPEGPRGGPGPVGPTGPAPHIRTRFYGSGPPETVIGASPGDEYVDTVTGNLYLLS